MLTIIYTYINRTARGKDRSKRPGFKEKCWVRSCHASIDFKISFRLQDFLQSGSPLRFETVQLYSMC